MRRWLQLIFAVCLIAGTLPLSKAEALMNYSSAPGTHARAYSLIDVTSGRILSNSHGDQKLPIASLTKIMTAIVAIEYGKLEDMVKVGPRAYGKEGSSLYLQLGEEMSLENLLYGLMLRSGNDAATAIAEHVGGSEEGFVHLMNEKVRLLGLHNTHFQNPHGLDAKDHYSSANDLAVITAYALHNPYFKKIVGTPSWKAPNPNNPWDYKWANKNKMLRFYEGADGVKTGFTKIAKRCLVSSATRNGQQLAVVTLNDGDDWSDHRNLLDYGFAHYSLSEVIRKGQAVQDGMVAGAGFSYPLRKGEVQKVERRLKLRPIVKEDHFGYRGDIHIILDGQEIGRVPVYDEGRVPKNPNADDVTWKQGSKLGGWPGSLMQVIRSLLFQGE